MKNSNPSSNPLFDTLHKKRFKPSITPLTTRTPSESKKSGSFSEQHGFDMLSHVDALTQSNPLIGLGLKYLLKKKNITSPTTGSRFAGSGSAGSGSTGGTRIGSSGQPTYLHHLTSSINKLINSQTAFVRSQTAFMRGQTDFLRSQISFLKNLFTNSGNGKGNPESKNKKTKESKDKKTKEFTDQHQTENKSDSSESTGSTEYAEYSDLPGNTYGGGGGSGPRLLNNDGPPLKPTTPSSEPRILTTPPPTPTPEPLSEPKLLGPGKFRKRTAKGTFGKGYEEGNFVPKQGGVVSGLTTLEPFGERFMSPLTKKMEDLNDIVLDIKSDLETYHKESIAKTDEQLDKEEEHNRTKPDQHKELQPYLLPNGNKELTKPGEQASFLKQLTEFKIGEIITGKLLPLITSGTLLASLGTILSVAAAPIAAAIGLYIERDHVKSFKEYKFSDSPLAKMDGAGVKSFDDYKFSDSPLANMFGGNKNKPSPTTESPDQNKTPQSKTLTKPLDLPVNSAIPPPSQIPAIPDLPPVKLDTPHTAKQSGTFDFPPDQNAQSKFDSKFQNWTTSIGETLRLPEVKKWIANSPKFSKILKYGAYPANIASSIPDLKGIKDKFFPSKTAPKPIVKSPTPKSLDLPVNSAIPLPNQIPAIPDLHSGELGKTSPILHVAKAIAHVPSEIVNAMAKIAIDLEKVTGYPAKVLMAQFALESKRGKNLTGEHNYFGIQGKGTAGSKMVMTHEEWTPAYKEKHHPEAVEDPNQKNVTSGKKRYQLQMPFAAYKNMQDSASEYIKFITKNQRYKGALENYKKTKDPDQLMRDIGKAGYASGNDSANKYGNALVETSRSSDLTASLVSINSGSGDVIIAQSKQNLGKVLMQISKQNEDIKSEMATTKSNQNVVLAPSSTQNNNTAVLSQTLDTRNTENTYRNTRYNNG